MSDWMRRMSWPAILIAGAILLYAGSDVPPFGDADSPASSQVSPRYIERAEEETGAPNMVTAVLADYRSYDTLGETVVILTAGLACLIVLGTFRRDPDAADEELMTYSFGSDVLDALVRMLIPFIALFALYVLVHGHDSPGGGFQGGAILAACVILLQLVRGRSERWQLAMSNVLLLACLGVLLYAGIGLASLFFSGHYLDYGALPLPGEGGHLRALGSLGVEVGVLIGVTAVLLLIFDALTEGS